MWYVIGRYLQVYHQEKTITKYLYQQDLPAMTEMSLCFWMKLEADDDKRDDDWLVSIARSGVYLHACIYIQCINSDLTDF